MHPPTVPRIPAVTQNVFIGQSQVFATLRPGHRPVSMITQRQVKPGCQMAFSLALRDFVGFARDFPGHSGLRVLTRIRGGREYFAVVDHFVNSAARCAFTSSPEFGLWLNVLRATTLDIPDLREAETTRASYPTEKLGTGRTAGPLPRTGLSRWLQALAIRTAQVARRWKDWLLSRH